MKKDSILWNVYTNIDSMDKLERNFYNLHYKYRRFIYTAEKNNVNFRNTKNFISLLNELNAAYEKIHNCSNEDKNEYGEYDYPKVAYKVKFDKINGTNITKKYASVSGTNCCRLVDAGYLVDYSYLYINGEAKIKRTSKDKNAEHLIVESSIKDVIIFFKENIDYLKNYSNTETLINAIDKLSDFPVDSITELDFNFLLDKVEFDIIKEDFFKEIEKKSKNTVETTV